MSELTDDQLLIMLQSGEDQARNKALKSIYQDNFRAIATFIKQNSGRPEDAEDIFQEGLMALYEQIIDGRFKGASTIKTYLFAICRNKWMKRLRKASVKKETLGNETDFADGAEQALDHLIADEEANTLADLLEQVGADCKKVLLLYYYERKRMQEIAQLMGFANAQIAKNKKSRCLKKLKERAQAIAHFRPF